MIISLKDYLAELESLFNEGLYDPVVGHAGHILKHYPKNVATYRLLGNALLMRKNPEAAAEVFQRVLSADPFDYAAHKGLSEIAAAQQQLDTAIWHMERIYDVFPNSAYVVGQLQNLYLARDNKQPERLQMSRAGLARQYMKGELFDQAATELQQALDLEAERLDLQIMLAEVLFAGGHLAGAGQVALAVLKALPDCLAANKLMAKLWLDNKRPEDAKPFLERLESLAPYESIALLTGNPNTPTLAFQIERLDWQGQRSTELASVPDWLSTMNLDEALGAAPGGGDAGQVFSEPDWVRASGGISLAPATPAPAFSDDMGDWFSQIEPAKTGELRLDSLSPEVAAAIPDVDPAPEADFELDFDPPPMDLPLEPFDLAAFGGDAPLPSTDDLPLPGDFDFALPATGDLPPAGDFDMFPPATGDLSLPEDFDMLPPATGDLSLPEDFDFAAPEPAAEFDFAALDEAGDDLPPLFPEEEAAQAEVLNWESFAAEPLPDSEAEDFALPGLEDQAEEDLGFILPGTGQFLPLDADLEPADDSPMEDPLAMMEDPLAFMAAAPEQAADPLDLNAPPPMQFGPNVFGPLLAFDFARTDDFWNRLSGDSAPSMAEVAPPAAMSAAWLGSPSEDLSNEGEAAEAASTSDWMSDSARYEFDTRALVQEDLAAINLAPEDLDPQGFWSTEAPSATSDAGGWLAEFDLEAESEPEAAPAPVAAPTLEVNEDEIPDWMLNFGTDDQDASPQMTEALFAPPETEAGDSFVLSAMDELPPAPIDEDINEAMQEDIDADSFALNISEDAPMFPPNPPSDAEEPEDWLQGFSGADSDPDFADLFADLPGPDSSPDPSFDELFGDAGLELPSTAELQAATPELDWMGVLNEEMPPASDFGSGPPAPTAAATHEADAIDWGSFSEQEAEMDFELPNTGDLSGAAGNWAWEAAPSSDEALAAEDSPAWLTEAQSEDTGDDFFAALSSAEPSQPAAQDDEFAWLGAGQAEEASLEPLNWLDEPEDPAATGDELGWLQEAETFGQALSTEALGGDDLAWLQTVETDSAAPGGMAPDEDDDFIPMPMTADLSSTAQAMGWLDEPQDSPAPADEPDWLGQAPDSPADDLDWSQPSEDFFSPPPAQISYDEQASETEAAGTDSWAVFGASAANDIPLPLTAELSSAAGDLAWLTQPMEEDEIAAAPSQAPADTFAWGTDPEPEALETAAGLPEWAKADFGAPAASQEESPSWLSGAEISPVAPPSSLPEAPAETDESLPDWLRTAFTDEEVPADEGLAVAEASTLPDNKEIGTGTYTSAFDFDIKPAWMRGQADTQDSPESFQPGWLKKPK